MTLRGADGVFAEFVGNVGLVTGGKSANQPDGCGNGMPDKQKAPPVWWGFMMERTTGLGPAVATLARLRFTN